MRIGRWRAPVGSRWLLVVVAVVVLGVGVGGPSLGAQPSLLPPQQIGTGTGNVGSLGVGSLTVIYALDQGTTPKETCGALRVWSIKTGRVFAPTSPDCDSEFSRYGDVAVAGERAVWSETFESNHVLAFVYAAAASPAGRPTQIKQRDWGNSTYDAYVGSLAADGAVVAFSTQAGAYTGGADASLWVGNTRSVRIVRHVTGWMDDVAVGGQLVAVGYRDGRVEVFRANGERVRSFPPGTAPGGIELDGGRLVTLGVDTVSVRTLDSGKTVQSRQLVRPGKGARLEDAHAGLIVYQVRQQLRLLRFSDGHDVALPAPRAPSWTLHARFGGKGLVITYPHVVKQLPWTTLRGL